MDALSLNSDLFLVPNNYSKFHMGKSPFEALIAMHMKFLWTFQLLFKVQNMPQMHLICILLTPNIEPSWDSSSFHFV